MSKRFEQVKKKDEMEKERKEKELSGNEGKFEEKIEK